MDPHSFYLLYPDPHSEKLPNPEPQKMNADPQPCFNDTMLEIFIPGMMTDRKNVFFFQLREILLLVKPKVNILIINNDKYQYCLKLCIK